MAEKRSKEKLLLTGTLNTLLPADSSATSIAQGVPKIAPEENCPPQSGSGFGLGLAIELGLGAIFLGTIFLAPSLVMLLIKRRNFRVKQSESILYEYNVLKFEFFDLSSQENGKFILYFGQLNICVIWFVQFQK